MKMKQNVWKRMLSALLAFAMIFALLPAMPIAEAATSKTLYLKPNDNWKQSNARFAAYFFGNGEKWVSMTDADNDGIYEVEVPSGFPSVIFCRMNPSTTANNWNNKWDQTGDLTIPTDGQNLFTVPAGSWSGATTTWSAYTPTYTVVGSVNDANESPADFLGAAWTVTNTANDMTLNSDGTYSKTYNGVAAGSYVIKVAKDHAWTVSYPASNKAFTVSVPSNVTIKFNPSTKEVSVEVVPITYTITFNGTNISSSSSTSPVNYGASFATTLSVGAGYKLPAAVAVTMGGQTVAAEYNAITGDLKIPSVTGDVVITAAGVPLAAYGVVLQLTGLTSSNAATSVQEGAGYTTTLTAQDGYTLPEAVTVTMGGQPIAAEYNATTGELKIPSVTGDVVITAVGVEIEVEPETITIYFENNWSWPDLKIHWWGSAAVADTVWPGVSMTYVDTTLNGVDRYVVEVPADVTGFLFNGTGQYGEDKSTDITSGWYDGICYYMDYDSATGSKTAVGYKYEPVAVPEEPVTNVTIHFRNTGMWDKVYYHAWIENGNNDTDLTTWPGAQITENADHKNWYTVTLSGLNAERGIGILFNNGNGGQTGDMLIIANGEYWYDDMNGGLLTQEPANFADGSVPTISYQVTFHFANAKNWGGVNLYTWTFTGKNPTGAWPGVALGQGSDGFYSCTFTYEAPEGQGLSFIFSGGGQTVDLSLDASAFALVDGVYVVEKWVVPTNTDGDGKYYADIVEAAEAIATGVVVNGNSVTFTYKNADATTVLLWTSIGQEGGNWHGYAMQRNEYGVFSITLYDVASGIHQYKYQVDVNEEWIADPLNSWNINGDSALLISDPNKDTNTITIQVHYSAPSAEWNISAWGANNLEPQYNFSNGVATIKLDGRDSQYLKFKIRKSIAGNQWAEQSGEFYVDLANIVSGTIDIWVNGDFSSSQSWNADVVQTTKIKSVELDYDHNTIVIVTTRPVENPLTAFDIFWDGVDANCIQSITANGSTYTLTLTKELSLTYLYQYSFRFTEQVKFADYDYTIGINTVYASDRFAEEFTYTGTDLGANWSEAYTEFVVWAPTAEKVLVHLYTSGTAGTNDLIEAVEMTMGDNGVWRATVTGNLNGVYYTYVATVDGEAVEAVDPYARTTGVNGKRGMVINLDSTNPTGWDQDTNPNPITSYTDAIIYELHVRDFSIHVSSGVSEANRGKYLAFTEKGTVVPGTNISTGIDYLKSLGITHLHLLPVYDYGSVDETTCDTFNWGYDPVNYNVPEGSYSTNPYDGTARVKEFKQMVQALHEAGISVIMDVVYNHVYDAGQFSMNKLVPNYFSRIASDGSYSNGSGCGNDTASEHEMVRKYIVESVMYWAEEYHINGFRFDLVGLLDATTINEIVDTVHAKYPDVIFYGEGWSLGTAVEPGNTMATQANSTSTPNFAYFSDTIRDLLGGKNGEGMGYVSGLTGKEEDLANSFMAKPWWSKNPTQIVQYISCHDNYTFIDKMVVSSQEKDVYFSAAELVKMNNLAATFYMLSQGIPFIHAGEEMLREKIEEDGSRCENSYNAPDSVNQIVWSKLTKNFYDSGVAYADTVEYYKGLIELRKAFSEFRLDTREKIDKQVEYEWITNEVVKFTISESTISESTLSERIVVIFNATKNAVQVSLPEGDWAICVNGEKAGTQVLGTATGNVNVAGISAMVLVDAEAVTVTLNDGQNTSTLTGMPGETMTATAPAKDGYTFLGWFAANGDPMPAKFPAANTTYYAKWQENYNLWVGGTQLNSSHTSGTGWSYDHATKTLTLNNATITGFYNNANIYTTEDLKIVLIGDNTLSSANQGIKVDGGNTLTICGDGTLYARGEWDGMKVEGGNVVISDVTITAIGVWSYGIQASNVTIDNSVVTIGGGMNASALTCGNVTIGSNCHVKITSNGQSAYSAGLAIGDGWYSNEEGVFNNEMPAKTSYFEYIGKDHAKVEDQQDGAKHKVSCEDVTFDEAHQYAEGICVCGAKDIYTITFDAAGGSAVESIYKEHGATAAAPADPTKDGYNFAGWYTDANCTDAFDFATAITSSMTLYAKWEAKDITLTLMDGDTLFDTLVGQADAQLTIENAPTKEGYTFAGWFTAEGAPYDGSVPTADTTYYAQWEINCYTVTVETPAGGQITVDNENPAFGQNVTFTVTADAGKEVVQASVMLNGQAVQFTENGDGTYTFVQPDGNVVISVTFQDEAPEETPEEELPEEEASEGAIPSFGQASKEEIINTVYEMTGMIVDTAEQAYDVLVKLLQLANSIWDRVAALIP